MTFFDVFNGDADGLCSLHQLRLADPRESQLVTGPKRDIALLDRIEAHAGDLVTVLDISLDANRAALMRLLSQDAKIRYFDHHTTSDVPAHPNLSAVIDSTPDVCTGILVDRFLGGRHRLWAAVAAFGDNLDAAARRLTIARGMTSAQTDLLRELGECLNYNAYGSTEADLIVHPATLYGSMRRHLSPFSFVSQEGVFKKIRDSRQDDLIQAASVKPMVVLPCGVIVKLPDAPSSRRVHGAYANLLAARCTGQAHAVLAPDGDGGYIVSVRAPQCSMHGADSVCRRFPGGGGRPAAAGINHLSDSHIPTFIHAFRDVFSRA